MSGINLILIEFQSPRIVNYQLSYDYYPTFRSHPSPALDYELEYVYKLSAELHFFFYDNEGSLILLSNY